MTVNGWRVVWRGEISVNLTQKLIQEDGQIIVSTVLGVTDFTLIFWHDDYPLYIRSLQLPPDLLFYLKLRPCIQIVFKCAEAFI